MNRFEEEYVLINGIRHFLLHYSRTPDAPVLLYLHGGPGSFESLFAYRLDSLWGNLFTHVHWDQRGAGKTLRKNGSAAQPKTIEQMLADLHGIVQHLQQKYHTDKIVILGHSWGSLLGSLYVQKHPSCVSAYIGSGQVVSLKESEQTAYRKTLKLAKAAGNKKHLRQLKKLRNYPPDSPELFLKQLPRFRKIQKAYCQSSVPKSSAGSLLNTMRCSPAFRWGDLISLLQIPRANRLLYPQMLSFHLDRLSPRYEVPVHYILGEDDTITPVTLARAYYDTIDAPYKTFTVIPSAGHDPMYEQPNLFAAALGAVCRAL